MPLLVCHNCGFHQNDGTICQKCGMPFFGHPTTAADGPKIASRPQKPDPNRAELLPPRLSNRELRQPCTIIIAILLILHKSHPPQVTADPQAAQQAESKIEASESAAAVRPARAAAPRFFRGQFTAAPGSRAGSATAHDDPRCRSNPQAQPTPAPAAPDPTIEEVQSSVKDVKVTMHDDRVEAYVVFNFHGEDLSLDLEGKLGVNDGVLQFQPTQGTLGSLPDAAGRPGRCRPENAGVSQKTATN
jgi:hypothetical protein